MNRSQNVIEWYWKHGKERNGEWVLSTGSWLDKLYAVADQAGRLQQALAQRRGAVALWGSSQTGKSTFLSGYIDKGMRVDGSGTALGWSAPALFSDAGKNIPKNVCVYNPFNGGNDGSACVTRFVLANMGDGTVDPVHPVQVRLFGQKQVLSALAFGFLTECDLEDDSTKQVIFWDATRIYDLLAAVGESSDPADREAYELLRDVIDVLELLIHSKDDRYRNLLASLHSIRQAALTSTGLLCSKEAVIGFAARLFWNGWDSLTKVFKDLMAMRQRLAGMSQDPRDPDLRISCSLEMASLLVDFSTYENLLKNDGRAHQVRGKRLAPGGVGLLLSEQVQAGQLLIAPGQEEDFAKLQALTWELIVPLRADILKTESPKLHQLLSVADLLDFPGTANEADPPDYKKLTNSTIGAGGSARIRVYTNIIKRGKTSSLVLANARNYDIDGFSIFAKWGTKIVQRGQLDGGISGWWQGYLNESFKDAKSKKLPLNFVVTFFGALVSQVINRGDLGTPGTDFEGFFSQLGSIRSPAVASSFVTTYNHVPGSKMESNRTGGHPSPDEKRGAYERLKAIPEFRHQFFDGNWHRPDEQENTSIQKAIFSEDGGTDYFIDKLISDAMQNHRQAKISERHHELEKLWHGLLSEALPAGGNENEAKREALLAWKEHLLNKLADRSLTDAMSDASQKLSFALRMFLKVDHNCLKDIPEYVVNMDSFDHADYLQQQLIRWKELLPERVDMELLGISDDSQALKFRGYLAETVLSKELVKNMHDPKGVVGLLRVTFGNTGPDRAADRRTFLAVALERALCGEKPRTEPHFAINADTLKTVVHQAQNGIAQTAYDYKRSAHFRRIIQPFLEFLDSATEVQTTGRPPQIGDDELLAILR